MKWDDLRRTLTDALETGKVGRPVSIRLYLHSVGADLSALIPTALELAAVAFPNPPVSLLARRDADAQQLSVLLQYEAGQTAMLTVVRANTPDSTAHLLLVGNHGIIRLEGGGDLELPPAPHAAGAAWRERIEQSLHRRAVVPVDR